MEFITRVRKTNLARNTRQVIRTVQRGQTAVIEAAKGLWFGRDELDFALLVEYSRRLGNRTAMCRLGFWLEQMVVGDPTLLQALEVFRDRNYARLDPGDPTKGQKTHAGD